MPGSYCLNQFNEPWLLELVKDMDGELRAAVLARLTEEASPADLVILSMLYPSDDET